MLILFQALLHILSVLQEMYIRYEKEVNYTKINVRNIVIRKNNKPPNLLLATKSGVFFILLAKAL